MKKLSKKDWSKLGTGVTCLLVAGMCWQYRTHLHGRLSTPSSGSRSVSSDGDNTFEGKVVDASGENISFITADADLTLLASKLPLETLATLKNASGKKERVTVFIPPSAIGSTNPVSVRADCTELPIKYEELVSRANDPKTTNSLDFLKSLPQGTMQTFTFVHDSKSLQKEGVDKLWPRVIRLSADAKLMFSYTCNPSAKTYNTVEVIRFDESTASYRFTEFDFRLGFFKKKVKEDPASCLSCHSPDKKYLDPRPIWQMYSTWDGVYGGNDDHFDSYQDGGYMTSYQDFRQKQKDNPCYAALPWPKQGEYANQPLFPYSTTYKTGDYHLRPNLKITEINSHLMGQRIARKFWSVPRFKQLRLLLAMDTFGCAPSDIDQQIKAANPEYEAPESYYNIASDERQLQSFEPRSSSEGGARLYAVGKSFGFKPADWTMSFDRPDSPVYNTGLSPDPAGGSYSDIAIFKVASAQLARLMSVEYPELMPLIKLGRGESNAFGQKFACIDDIGGELVIERNAGTNKEACRILDAKFKEWKASDESKNLADLGNHGSIEDYVRAKKKLDESEGILLKDYTQEHVKLGKKIAQESCFSCHSESGKIPTAYRFFKDEASVKEAMKEDHAENDDVFIKTIAGRLDSDDDKMPPNRDLTPEEKTAVKAYFQSLSNQ